MRRNGTIKWMLLAALTATVAIAAAGCGEEDHTHIASEAWAFNAEEHWHPASCSHDVKLNKSAHVFEDVVVPPSSVSAGYTLHTCACGYSYVTDGKDPVLPEATEYRYNAEGHWKPVLSGERTVEEHTYTDETVAPTCTAAGYTKHSCACGYWYASDPTAPIAHSPEGVWGHNGSAHWKICLVCGSKEGVAAHTYTETVTPPACDAGGYTTFTCTDCGYTFRGRETAAGHSFGDTLVGDEYEHWFPATCEHDTERAEVREHVLEGHSNVCSICGKAVEPRLAYALSADKEYYIVTGIGCAKGTEIVVPATYHGLPVREIAPRAFKGETVTAVTFGENVVKIGAEAFSGAQISAVTFGENVKEIGAKAFESTAIGTLTIGGTVESVGQGAFQNCTSLTAVTLGSTALETLPYYLFAGCTQLQTVGGTTKVKTVLAHAFNGCEALGTIDLSACTKVEFAAFNGCTQLQNVTSLAELAATEQYAFAGSGLAAAELPKLKNVAENLFEGCTALGSVTLSAESIGTAAFKGCTSLETVTPGTALVTVGGSAFEGCPKLTSLTLPEAIIRVGADAFKETGLIAAENGVQYAANVAVGLASGTAATLRAGTVGVADEAFKDTAITAVTLADEVRFIGVNAFRKCEKLTAVEFKANVKSIGANSFRESGLTSVTVPATVLSVGESAFYDCKSLTTVSVSAKEIGRFAFSYTGEGRTLDSPVKVRPQGAKLTTLTVGEGVEKIGSNAFQYAPITAVTLPASLKEVGGYAFAQTDLAAIAIPAGVTRIGAYAFYGCTKLASATFATTAGWTAGGTALDLATPATNATHLKMTYNNIEWVRG